MRRFGCLLVLCLPALLAACGWGGGRAVAPSATPLPSYGVGDSYSFNDGTTRTVTAADGERVFWRGNGSDTIVTTRDVLLPPLSETTPQIVVRRQVDSPGLFPLSSGKGVAFGMTVTWKSRTGGAGTLRGSGECAVGQHARVTTPAGTFETIRVACTLRSAGNEDVLRRTYFYAPSIAYFVRRDDKAANGPRHRVELVHYAVGNPALPNAALLERSRAIQRALEHDVSGAPVEWHDPIDGANGSVVPVLTEHSPLYGWCREFRERMQIAARDYDLIGTACRGQGGMWLVKEVTPFQTASR